MESSYARLFRNRNYVRVFAAGLSSTAGQAISGVCLVWIVYTETQSALDVAYLGTGFLLAAMLFSTLGGTLVDRYDRRRLMIVSDLARGVATLVVVLVLAVRGFNLPLIVAAFTVIGAFSVLFNPAEQAIVPALVGPAEVADANGLVRSSRSVLQFVGASVAGVLIVSVGPLWGIGTNVATFALSAALLTGMRVASLPAPATSPGARASYLADLRAGFAWLWRAKAFLQLTLSATFFNFSANVIATFLVIYSTVVLHGSALVFASLLAAEVAGSAIGALLVGRTGATRFAGKAWVVPYGVVSGAVALLLPLYPNVGIAIAVIFALGTLGGFAGTAWLTAAQLLVPTEMQGRYFGIDQLGSVAILPAAQIGGALLITAYGVQSTYLAAAIFWVIAGVAFLAPRALWRMGVDPGRTAGRRDGGAEVGPPEASAGTQGP